MLLVFESEEVKEDQAQAQKKRNEAAQHPRSETKRIGRPRREADGIESKRKCKPEPGNEYPPAQKAFAIFRLKALRASQPLFGEDDGFLVVHITQEGEEAKNDQEHTYNTEAWNKVSEHVSSQEKAWSWLYCISVIHAFLDQEMIVTGLCGYPHFHYWFLR